MSEIVDRLRTGIAGVDAILRGGLIQGGVFLVTGQPGSGKTIFGNQVCFAHARGGGRAIYCTLLAETHGRMLANLRTLSFFDETMVGNAITYLEGFGTLEKDGLDGALKLLRDSVRERKATLLVVDGTVAAEKMSPSDVAYKKFIQGLKSWVDLVDCTVILLTSSGAGLIDSVRPEHTMVDGILHLTTRQSGMRMLRELCVRKLRGGPHLDGFHSYQISSDGLIAWPRLEGLFVDPTPGDLGDDRVGFGLAELDRMLDGGVRRNSVSLVVGASGAGKTQLAMQFLAAGTAQGERCLYYGLFETPAVISDIARRVGIASDAKAPLFSIIWHPDTERLLDMMAADLLRAVDTTSARRLVIDGMVAFKIAGELERLPGYFAALNNELRRRGVTTVMTEELRDVVNTALYVPVDNISGSFDNILFLRQSEAEGTIVRHLSVVKTRAAGHDRTPRRFDVTNSGIEIATAPRRARPTPKRGKRGR